MTHKQIRDLLSACPPTRNDGGDPRLKKALKAADSNAELKASLDAQTQFDSRIAERLQAISLPASLKECTLNSLLPKQTSFILSLREPAFLPVAVSALLLIGLSIWLFFGKISSFPGSSEIWQVASAGGGPSQAESVDLKMDALDDWFAMKGMDQFWAPPGLSELDVVGARVYNFVDIPVAMGVIAKPAISFYVFDGIRLGIQPPEGKWQILKKDRKVIAVTRHEEFIFAIASDNQGELRKFVQDLRTSGK